MFKSASINKVGMNHSFKKYRIKKPWGLENSVLLYGGLEKYFL